MKLYHPDKLVTWPWFIQPKLNGVYAEIGTDGLFRSKTGKYFPAVQKIFKTIPREDLIYCGEFYVHGWSLQTILSAVTPEEPNTATELIEYHTYDCQVVSIPNAPQYQRLDMLDKYARKVETYSITSHREGTNHYHEFLSQGFEGAVYRPYGYGELLKRKPFKDAEFLCAGVVEGVGKRLGHVGKFILSLPDGRMFHCGGGRVSYDRLKVLLTVPPIGKMITVRYQHTSDGGIPLCSQFIAVRDYD
jgi:ATP-dependent DNA ligase